MTSQIVPGANQQFHKVTPLFWGGQKNPPTMLLPSRFPHRKSPPFYGVGRLGFRKPVKLKTLGNFFQVASCNPEKWNFATCWSFFFFQIAGHWDGTVLKSLLHQKLVFFWAGNKKSFNTWQLQPFPESETTGETESGETTMTPCYACDRHDQGVVPGLLAPPKGSKENIHSTRNPSRPT